jgi:hypothetical protein
MTAMHVARGARRLALLLCELLATRDMGHVARRRRTKTRPFR